MAPIVATTDIARSPDVVFAYVTDPTKLSEWQESVVRAESSEAPARAGTKARVTRRVGKREMTMSAELTNLSPRQAGTCEVLTAPFGVTSRGRSNRSTAVPDRG